MLPIFPKSKGFYAQIYNCLPLTFLFIYLFVRIGRLEFRIKVPVILKQVVFCSLV